MYVKVGENYCRAAERDFTIQINVVSILDNRDSQHVCREVPQNMAHICCI